MIVPICHYSSTTHLDEDVYDEMRIWRKVPIFMRYLIFIDKMTGKKEVGKNQITSHIIFFSGISGNVESTKYGLCFY